jgi:hypothetical protein
LTGARKFCRRCDRFVDERTLFCPDCGSLLEIRDEGSPCTRDARERVRRSLDGDGGKATVGIEFVGSERMGHSTIIKCSWDVHFPSRMNGQGVMEDCRSWTESRIRTGDHVNRWISGPEVGEGVHTYKINISGIGRDGRCAWCRTFRSVLETRMRRDGMLFVREGECFYGY